jgi:hypothetical protein
MEYSTHSLIIPHEHEKILEGAKSKNAGKVVIPCQRFVSIIITKQSL